MNASPWRLSHRADPLAARLADRHYNRRKVGSPQFVPPSTCLVLKTAINPATGLPGAVWVTSWPFAEYVAHDWAGAWINSLFRSEQHEHRASDLIRWAVAHTRDRWPDVPPLGIVTFVDPACVRGTLPGYSYKRAGWRHVGYTVQRHLWAWQQTPDRMPAPAPVPYSQARLFEIGDLA